jgi:hypothetical protein
VNQGWTQLKHLNLAASGFFVNRGNRWWSLLTTGGPEQCGVPPQDFRRAVNFYKKLHIRSL